MSLESDLALLAHYEDGGRARALAEIMALAERRQLEETERRSRGKTLCVACSVEHPIASRCPGCDAKWSRVLDDAIRESRIPIRFAWAHLAAPELSCRAPAKAIASATAALATKRLPNIVFAGPTGSGKTSLAAACARAVMERSIERNRTRMERDDRPFAAKTCARITWALAHTIGTARDRLPYGEDDAEIIDDAKSADLLVVDDIGTGGSSPRAKDTIIEVVFHRHDADRPTWITTWQTPTDLAATYGAGVARRLMEGAVTIDCGAR